MERADIIGRRFGRLVVVARGETTRRLVCKCDCGSEGSFIRGNLTSGNTSSCGCLRLDRVRKHGAYKTVEYRTWRHMIERCTVTRHPMWKHYGGRGITVCDEWLENFPAFLAHIGPRPSPKHSVDRIDNARGYEPGNVRWATRVQQMRNTRVSQRVEFRGECVSVAEAAERAGLKYSTVRGRISRGWPVGRALAEVPCAAS
jgi:hypothetical protein